MPTVSRLMRPEVHTAVKMSMLVFWVVTPCGHVVGYQCFGGTYCRQYGASALNMEAVCSSEILEPPTSPYGVTTQTTMDSK
jgi:hypothetical protein